MFDEFQSTEIIENNISEIQIINAQLFMKIQTAIQENKNPAEHIKNLKELLEMQEGLTRLSIEVDSYIMYQNEEPDE